ncbi:MAG: vitamin K epoxide reductase family protein [Patescibacteria group bacterium]
MDHLIYLGIIILAIIGFFVAFRIYREKKKKTPLICPRNFKCDGVVKSRYSKLFGAPVELFGIIYYVFIAVIFTLFLFLPTVVGFAFILFIFLVTSSAFSFSIYLTYIQIFKIKEFCSWCLTSAAISTVIFFLVLTLLI